MSISTTAVIGITVYNSKDEFQYYPDDYLKAVRLFGAIPVLMPPGEPNSEQLIRSLDGIILTGGGDINPKCYAQAPHDELYWVNDEQDNYELTIARQALNLNKPVLATCRGMQVINILLGGSLHQHIPDHYGDCVWHRSPKNQAVNHDVYLEQDSGLAQALGATKFSVKSWHHQSISQLASGFRAIGFADDGVIEAIESEAYPNLVAVQWHPEIDNQDNSQQQKLFQSWLAKCTG